MDNYGNDKPYLSDVTYLDHDFAHLSDNTFLVPTRQRGNAVSNAPALRWRVLRWRVGTRYYF